MCAGTNQGYPTRVLHSRTHHGIMACNFDTVYHMLKSITQVGAGKVSQKPFASASSNGSIRTPTHELFTAVRALVELMADHKEDGKTDDNTLVRRESVRVEASQTKHSHSTCCCACDARPSAVRACVRTVIVHVGAVLRRDDADRRSQAHLKSGACHDQPPTR